MRKLIDIGNRYAEKSSWKDFALVKLCLFSLGLIAGTQIKEKHKKAFLYVSAAVFFMTYIPLMRKLIGITVSREG